MPEPIDADGSATVDVISSPEPWSASRRAILAGLTVAVGLGGIGAALFVRGISQDKALASPDLALAVLPFEARTPGTTDATLRLGDVLRADLGRIEGLRVVAGRSRAAGTSVDSVHDIAQALNVSLLLQGVVIRNA